MGGIFRSPPPVVVNTPQQSATQGSTEIQPYAPVVPFIDELLPQIKGEFQNPVDLYTAGLVPGKRLKHLVLTIYIQG